MGSFVLKNTKPLTFFSGQCHADHSVRLLIPMNLCCPWPDIYLLKFVSVTDSETEITVFGLAIKIISPNCLPIVDKPFSGYHIQVFTDLYSLL